MIVHTYFPDKIAEESCFISFFFLLLLFPSNFSLTFGGNGIQTKMDAQKNKIEGIHFRALSAVTMENKMAPVSQNAILPIGNLLQFMEPRNLIEFFCEGRLFFGNRIECRGAQEMDPNVLNGRRYLYVYVQTIVSCRSI